MATLLVLAAPLLASAAAADPLACFEAERPSSPGNNVCFGQYKVRARANLTACAQACIAQSCDQFVFTSGTDCRMSHDCKKPDRHLPEYTGYMRKPGPNCGGAPAPTPPPPPPPPPSTGFRFGRASNPHLFTPGMILQRGGAKVWGSGAAPSGTVTVTVVSATGGLALAEPVSVTATAAGDWTATVTASVTPSATLKATEGSSTATVADVAVGEAILCGGQVRDYRAASSAWAVPATPWAASV